MKGRSRGQSISVKGYNTDGLKVGTGLAHWLYWRKGLWFERHIQGGEPQEMEPERYLESFHTKVYRLTVKWSDQSVKSLKNFH